MEMATGGRALLRLRRRLAHGEGRRRVAQGDRHVRGRAGRGAGARLDCRPRPPEPLFARRVLMVRTTCPYCGVGCGVLAPEGGGAVAGDPDHPANAGRLCSKGSALGETLGLEGRLLLPEIDGVRADWDTALDMVAGRFARTIAETGPDSVALYVSGQLLTCLLYTSPSPRD